MKLFIRCDNEIPILLAIFCCCCPGQIKGQLNSELIYEVIVSAKIPSKNLKDFCPVSLLEGKAEILKDRYNKKSKAKLKIRCQI